jgi:hypothetical protein
MVCWDEVLLVRPNTLFGPAVYTGLAASAEMSSPGMLSYLNAKIGQPYGPSARVVGIQSLQGYPATTGSYLTCRGTIVLESGAQESGTLSVQDPGGNAKRRVGSPPLTLSANALYVGQVVTWAAAKLPH